MSVAPISAVQNQQPEQPLDDPDVLILNALLASRTWNPEAHGITPDMLGGYRQAWAFCQDYQNKTGAPPSIEHFARSFPSVEMLGGVNVEWAADKVRQKFYERQMRSQMMSAIASLNAGDYELAREALLEVTKPSPTGRPQGMDIYSVESIAEETVKLGWQSFWGRLMAVTGGLKRGELWYLGARLGQGKSWLAACHAISAAEQGARVAVASVEMPMVEYTNRVHSLLAREDAALRKALRGRDLKMRRAALEAAPKLPGSIEVFDPSRLRMNLTGIETLCAQYDIVVVDHVGLLADATGKRSVEDWRVAAVISNSLKEFTLRYGMSILGVVQVNREGESATDSPPKVSQLAQTDALGQDADVITTHRRMGDRAMKHYIAKNRTGPNDTFYSNFLPGEANFAEISQEQARNISMEDKDRSQQA